MYVLSKFRFKLSVVHKHRPEEVSTHTHVSSPSDNWGRESQIPHFILVSDALPIWFRVCSEPPRVLP
jgi:hypothetical protein